MRGVPRFVAGFALKTVGTSSTPPFYAAACNPFLCNQALAARRKAYGKMLEAKATTWWEHFGGSASLGHASSTAPTSDRSVYVPGVQLTGPGYAAFLVEPYPSDLKWARGVIPTVCGDVQVAWSRAAEKFTLLGNVAMPAHIESSVPAENRAGTRLSGKRRPEQSGLQRGRARYWVGGPGIFPVESIRPNQGEEP